MCERHIAKIKENLKETKGYIAATHFGIQKYLWIQNFIRYICGSKTHHEPLDAKIQLQTVVHVAPSETKSQKLYVHVSLHPSVQGGGVLGEVSIHV